MNSYLNPVTSNLFSEMVSKLVKSPDQLAAEVSASDLAMIHPVLGIAGEAGELVDAIKKSVIYRKPIDRENVIEELGDLEFYMEDLRQRIGITREETIRANMAKLAERYKDFQYTDQRAHERADKSLFKTCPICLSELVKATRDGVFMHRCASCGEYFG